MERVARCRQNEKRDMLMARDGAAIIARLGGRKLSNGGWSFCCPCHNDHKPSAGITANGVVNCLAGCPREQVEAALDRLGFPDTGKTYIKEAYNYENEINKAQRMWDSALDDPDVVAYYLNRRGITIAVPDVMRRWKMNGVISCLQQLDGRITAVCTKEYGKQGRTDGWMGRGAVWLAQPRDGEIGIAEGVETALSATQITGVPCWASLGGNRMKQIQFPSEIRLVYIFADNDEPGQKYAQEASDRFNRWKIDTCIWSPPEKHKDWNDVLNDKELGAKHDGWRRKSKA